MYVFPNIPIHNPINNNAIKATSIIAKTTLNKRLLLHNSFFYLSHNKIPLIYI